MDQHLFLTESVEMADVSEPNHLLRRARLRLLSPSGSGRRMSRQELAEAVATKGPDEQVYELSGPMKQRPA
jgi:hypothetical protein